MMRQNIQRFIDIPNVGKATAKDFLLIGINNPIELVEKDPYEMYDELCRCTCLKHDPCVIDVFISAVRYMEGGPQKMVGIYY